MSGMLNSDIFLANLPDGRRIMYVLPVVPDGAPPQVKEGISRRRVAMLEGRCPCGASVESPNRSTRRAAAKAGVAAPLLVEHEPDCSASDVALARLGWSA